MNKQEEILSKCKRCGEVPKRKINRQPATKFFKGEFYTIEPEVMIDYAYYECNCGIRYTPAEMGEPRETWKKEAEGEEEATS